MIGFVQGMIFGRGYLSCSCFWHGQNAYKHFNLVFTDRTYLSKG